MPPEIATLTPQVPVDPNATPTPTFDPNATPTPTFDPNATPTVQLVGPTARFFAIVEGQRLPEGNEGGIPVVTVAPGVPITFNASESTGGSSEITQYYWDMGDGTPPISNNAVPPHTYGAEGRYIVTLTVTDANNLSSEARDDRRRASAAVGRREALPGSLRPAPLTSDYVRASGKCLALRLGGNHRSAVDTARAQCDNQDDTLAVRCGCGDVTKVSSVR
ncbi:MAG: PKD domain-containing protein [Caldilineaceae bacterium]